MGFQSCSPRSLVSGVLVLLSSLHTAQGLSAPTVGLVKPFFAPEIGKTPLADPGIVLPVSLAAASSTTTAQVQYNNNAISTSYDPTYPIITHEDPVVVPVSLDPAVPSSTSAFSSLASNIGFNEYVAAKTPVTEPNTFAAPTTTPEPQVPAPTTTGTCTVSLQNNGALLGSDSTPCATTTTLVITEPASQPPPPKIIIPATPVPAPSIIMETNTLNYALALTKTGVLSYARPFEPAAPSTPTVVDVLTFKTAVIQPSGLGSYSGTTTSDLYYVSAPFSDLQNPSTTSYWALETTTLCTPGLGDYIANGLGFGGGGCSTQVQALTYVLTLPGFTTATFVFSQVTGSTAAPTSSGSLSAGMTMGAIYTLGGAEYTQYAGSGIAVVVSTTMTITAGGPGADIGGNYVSLGSDGIVVGNMTAKYSGIYQNGTATQSTNGTTTQSAAAMTIKSSFTPTTSSGPLLATTSGGWRSESELFLLVLGVLSLLMVGMYV